MRYIAYMPSGHRVTNSKTNTTLYVRNFLGSWHRTERRSILTVLVLYWGRFHYFDGRVGRRSVHHKNFRFNVDPGIAPEMIFHEIFILHGIYKIHEILFNTQQIQLLDNTKMVLLNLYK